jgi:hypothetical protein
VECPTEDFWNDCTDDWLEEARLGWLVVINWLEEAGD